MRVSESKAWLKDGSSMVTGKSSITFVITEFLRIKNLKEYRMTKILYKFSLSDLRIILEDQ